MPRVYHDLLAERYKNEPTVSLSIRDRQGSLIDHEFSYNEIAMPDGEPIAPPMMDIAFQLILSHDNERVMSEPTLMTSRADTFQWICDHPPAPGWLGLRIIPHNANGCWSMLLEDYHGPETDR